MLSATQIVSDNSTKKPQDLKKQIAWEKEKKKKIVLDSMHDTKKTKWKKEKKKKDEGEEKKCVDATQSQLYKQKQVYAHNRVFAT